MKARHILSFLATATLLACGASSDKSQDSQAAADSSSTPEAGADWPSCTAWLADFPHPGGDTVCDSPKPEDVQGVQYAGAAWLTLSSGRKAAVWLPDDWASRTDRSLLVLLHGSVGCAEGQFTQTHILFGDRHALVALAYEGAGETVADPSEIHADLAEVRASLHDHCPMEGTTELMYGLSRGGGRAVQVAGLDVADGGHLDGIVVDSGPIPGRSLDGLSFDGANLLLWCGEYDPSPIEEGRTTCDVMQNDLGPLLQSRGAQVELMVGEASCHGMVQWECNADCSDCAGTADPMEWGPNVTAVADWLDGVVGG